MSSPHRLLNALAVLVILAVVTSCYAYGGKPAGSDLDELSHWAHQACARGDQRAYDVLVERMLKLSADPETIPDCPE